MMLRTNREETDSMFHITYCDYNRTNPDYDIINRPYGSGDYLLLLFWTPMKVHLYDKIIQTREGAFLLFSPGFPQVYQSVRRFHNSFIHFTCDDDLFVKEYDIPLNQVIYPSNPALLNELCRSIYVENVSKMDFYAQQSDHLMHQLLILLSRQYHICREDSAASGSLYPQFQKARTEILTNIDRDWSSSTMAALTNLGISQFYHYYKLFFNRSPKAELLDARLERAKYLLQIEKLPVSQAAAQSGFDNLSHFTRYFKSYFGMSPSEYANTRVLTDQ